MAQEPRPQKICRVLGVSWGGGYIEVTTLGLTGLTKAGRHIDRTEIQYCATILTVA
jgi:hypothetical protein